MRSRTATPKPTRAGSSLVALACAALTAFACEPAEQAAAERRAREVSRQVARSASVHARHALRVATREIRDFEDKARHGAHRVRVRSDEARELIEKFTPPPESTPPVLPASAITCEGDECRIDRATVELYAKEPLLLLHEGSVLPLPSGDPSGALVILSLRAGGLGEQMGLRTGDTLLDIDGEALATLLSDPAARRRLGRTQRWTLHLTRDGAALQRSLALR